MTPERMGPDRGGWTEAKTNGPELVGRQLVRALDVALTAAMILFVVIVVLVYRALT